jgi:glycosyltransferase involved in cell wall biosynthesis
MRLAWDGATAHNSHGAPVMEVVLVHYSYPPVIGGVESILRQHAVRFARHGHSVHVLAGAGESDAHATVEIVPELAATHPLGVDMVVELAAGAPGPAFGELQRRLVTFFTERLGGVGAVFVHNIFTMPFHLAATAALWAWVQSRPKARVVNWVHDLAVINSDYEFPKGGEFPWNLLRQPPAGARNVAVSERRRQEFERATGVGDCIVVPNGFDPIEGLQLTPPVAALAKAAGWPVRWPVLFHPTRLLRRKNVELGIAVTAALRDAGERPLYVVTGASDPHHAPSREYAESLRRLVRESDLPDCVIFAHDHFPVSETDVSSLYRLADALFYPSRQEGFGLPVIEAALHRLPIFCPRIEPLTELGGAHWFDLDAPAADVAQLVREVLLQNSENCVRRSAFARFDWDALYPRFLAPLLDGAPAG